MACGSVIAAAAAGTVLLKAAGPHTFHFLGQTEIRTFEKQASIQTDFYVVPAQSKRYISKVANLQTLHGCVLCVSCQFFTSIKILGY